MLKELQRLAYHRATTRTRVLVNLLHQYTELYANLLQINPTKKDQTIPGLYFCSKTMYMLAFYQ